MFLKVFICMQQYRNQHMLGGQLNIFYLFQNIYQSVLILRCLHYVLFTPPSDWYLHHHKDVTQMLNLNCGEN